MKETRYAYAAGLIDADGSLYISKSTLENGYVSYDPTLMLRSTHLPTIKWFVSKFGGTYSKSTWENGEHKDYYRWKFSSDKHASRFLDKITPYLWLKKDQAVVLKNYFDLEGANAPEEREKLRLKIS